MNDLNKENQFLKKIYNDILNGYTLIENNNKKYYFKHLNEKELGVTNNVYIAEYNNAKKQGLLPEIEKIELLQNQGIWTEEEENILNELKDEISNLETTKSKLIIKSQIEDIEKKTNLKKEKYKKIISQREEAVGMTAEDFALKKSNEYILYISLYKDQFFKEKFFENENDFWEKDAVSLLELFTLYKEYAEFFEILNIKKISVAPFFMNVFLLSEDNIYNFYGKSIVELTQYQIDLFSLARGYKNNLIKIGQNPPNNYKNYKELLDWYESNTSFSNMKNNKNQSKEKSGQTYIGATKEEIKKMAEMDGASKTVDLVSEADKLGTNLTFDQILKIHGEI